MQIINVPVILTKDAAAQLLGLKVYDLALPQQWLDDACLNLRLSASVRNGRIPKGSLYDAVLCGTVWCYDRCETLGEPMPLTDKAAELLSILAELKGQPVPQYEQVLRFEDTRGEQQLTRRVLEDEN